MIQNHWFSYTALGLIAGIGLTLVFVTWLELQPAQKDEVLQNSSRFDQFNSTTPPHASKNIGPDDPDHPKFYEHQDLKAQRSVAQATDAIVLWTKISVILGALGAITIVWTLFETRRSVETANRALIIENRPWVFLNPSSFSDLQINENGAQATILVTLSNTGNNPAQRVQVHSKAISFDSDDHATEMDTWARNISSTHKDTSWDITLFTGVRMEVRVHVMVPDEIIKKEVQRSSLEMFSPVFALGVFYTSDLDHSVRYTTSLFTLSKTTREGAGRMSIAYIRGTVKADTLRLDSYSGLIKAT